jgi:hypothetical protein
VLRHAPHLTEAQLVDAIAEGDLAVVSSAFFVDDGANLVAAAHEFGNQGANLLRDPSAEPSADVPVIRSLREVLGFL